MMHTIQLMTLCVILSFLQSCSSSHNKWTDKDCEYADYYQSSPVCRPDCNYYHSDPIQQ